MNKTGATTTNDNQKRVEAPVDYTQPLKNNKYERFCQEYMIDSNGAQSAIRAGYSDKFANGKGHQLTTIDCIKKRLAFLAEKRANECDVTIRQIADEFKKIGFGKVSKTLSNRDKSKALENLGKHTGFYEKDNSQKKENLADFLKVMINAKD